MSNLFSPRRSGYSHCMYLATAYRRWSAVMTAGCPLLVFLVMWIMTSVRWQMVAGDWIWSCNSGNNTLLHATVEHLMGSDKQRMKCYYAASGQTLHLLQYSVICISAPLVSHCSQWKMCWLWTEVFHTWHWPLLEYMSISGKVLVVMV